jgi:hypothetical protein
MMHNTAMVVVGLEGLMKTLTYLGSEFTDKMRTVRSKDTETDCMGMIL